MENDPYRAEAGPELDAVIHGRLMKQTAAAGSYPAYSTNDKLAKQVLSRMKMGKPSVIVGHTSLPGRTWFARYEGDAAHGTEVFADTFALAICRLALLLLEETEAGR